MAKKQKGWSLSLSSRAPALSGLNTCLLRGLHLLRTLLEPTRSTHGPWRDIEDLDPRRSSACLRSPPPPVCLSQELALPYSYFPQLDPSLCSSACVTEALLSLPIFLSSVATALSCLDESRSASEVFLCGLSGLPWSHSSCCRHLQQLSAKFWVKELI